MVVQASIWEIVSQASPLVQSILVFLIICSITSWTIIIKRSYELRLTKKQSKKFYCAFWSGLDLNNWIKGWKNRQNNADNNEYIIAAGLQELEKLKTLTHLTTQARINALSRVMEVAQAKVISTQENGLNILATIGSTSPYIGLFGTVWGIMSSFRAIGQAGQATLAMVAPGIAEALIATAIGLFAAIPAVIAYNRFNNTIYQLDNEYGQLSQSFLSLIYRQLEQQLSDQYAFNKDHLTTTQTSSLNSKTPADLTE